MSKSSKRMILIAVFAGGMAAAAGGASASTVCVNATHGSTSYGPDASCTTSMEQEVFLESLSTTTKGFGNIGSQTGLPLVEFTSTDTLDLKNGNATITPSAHGGAASFPNLDITVPGHTFTDLVFDVQMLDTHPTVADTENLTVTLWDGSTNEGTFTYNDLTHDADILFTIVDTSGLTAVDLSSTTGITEAKHFDVSGVGAIPEPTTWVMMLLGFTGLGYAGYRKGKSERTCLSVA